MSAARQTDAGFTLIEAMVALVILALGSVSLLTATEGHTARITALTERIAARWAADHRLAETRLGSGTGGPIEILGRDWAVTTETGDTADPDLASVSVSAALASRSGDTLVTLRSYMAVDDLPGEIE